MGNKIKLPLKMESNSLFLDKDKIADNKAKLEIFLKDESEIHSINFAKSVLLANEVQSNNGVEGYYDDIKEIENVIKNSNNSKNKNKQEKLRILNLYKGYKYILNKEPITKENLKKLYDILSNGLLNDYEIKNMGEFYRLAPVYIYYSSRLNIEPLEGMDYNNLDSFMNDFFKFINYNLGEGCITDEFIKSQIMHFYFVYIHPYFDINGRTSRTTAIWHLLNKEAYPYIIFNRGIKLNMQEYYKVIMDVRKFHNISFFVNYMMKTVLVELQKEHVVQDIIKQNGKLNAMEYQTLHYLLSMKGIRTLCDFSKTYSRYNSKKSPQILYKEMIEPLLDKGIILKGRNTKTKYDKNDYNFVIDFNTKYIDDNPEKTGELHIKTK